MSGTARNAIRCPAAMIRKLKSGEYRLYSRKKNPKAGKRRNLGTRLLRRLARQFGEAIPIVEDDRFMACPVCGQFFDMRDFVEVYYHYDRPHEPMIADA